MVKLVALLFSVVQYKNDSASQLNNNFDKVNYWAYAWKMSFKPDPLKQAQEVIFLASLQKTIILPYIFIIYQLPKLPFKNIQGFP